MKENLRIIVRMPNWIGDIVMGLPVLERLKMRYPTAHITALCKKPFASLIELDPNIDELIGYTTPSGKVGNLMGAGVIDQIKEGRYDLGVLLTNSLSSAVWMRRAGVKGVIGFARGVQGALLSQKLPFPEKSDQRHQVVIYQSLVSQLLGCNEAVLPPRLYTSEEESAAFCKKWNIEPSAQVIGINPGASYGPAKCWLPDRYRAVAERLLADYPEVRIMFFGDSSSRQMIDAMCKELGERVINCAGETSVRELMHGIGRCELFLTNDSGPMHIAAALHTPLVALFGSTSDVRTGPYGSGSVIHKRVECSPCYRRTCPIDFRCMKKIEVDEVIQKLEGYLHVKTTRSRSLTESTPRVT